MILMRKHCTRVMILTLTLILMAGSASSAIPIRPANADSLDYLDVVFEIIDRYYVEEVDGEKLVEGAFRGVFEELDPYSAYYTAEEYKRYTENTGGSFGGIGITVTKDDETDYIKVVSPIEDTPGYEAGIQPNDLIIGVNGNSLKGVSLEEAVRIMRGEVGTKLRLSIQRQGVADPIEVDLIREIIEINPVDYEIREDGLAYLRLKSFNANSAEDFRLALKDIGGKDEVTGLIIDLRNNPGGRLEQVVEIADMFLDVEEPIVQIDYRAYDDKIFKAVEEPILEIPVAVLINEGSASASEILAGALQDNGVATIIGTNSYGKGTVQSVIDLQEDAGMKITIAHYLTGGGHPVNEVGIQPDVEVSSQMIGSASAQAFAPTSEKRVYKPGEMGLNVYGVQQRLNFLGYPVEPTGVFNEETVSQLEKFEADYGLESSNKIDQDIIRLLNAVVGLSDETVEMKDMQLEKAVQVLLGQ